MNKFVQVEQIEDYYDFDEEVIDKGINNKGKDKEFLRMMQDYFGDNE